MKPMMKPLAISLATLGLAGLGVGVVTAQQATGADPADEALDDLFDDPAEAGLDGRVLRSVSGGGEDAASAGVSPRSEPMALRREGTFIFDRVGRVERSAEGGLPRFVFEADGQALRDPPVMLLPNLKLMIVEDTLDEAGSEGVRFRITGEVTEYNGRNYVLLQKVIALR